MNDVRSLFPNRTEVWGWLSFCSSKQPFQPLLLQHYEWGGGGKTLDAQCHHGDGCQGASGSGTSNEAAISVGLGKAKPNLQMILGAESNAGDHKLKPVYPDRRDRIGRQHLPITPCAPNLHLLLLPSHSPHWPILISVQHHLQPASLHLHQLPCQKVPSLYIHHLCFTGAAGMLAH